VLTDVNEQAVTEAAEAIRAEGERGNRRAAWMCAATTRSQAAVALAVERYGSLDILLNSAGGNCRESASGRSGAFHELDIEVIDWGLDVNLKGALYFCHATARAYAPAGARGGDQHGLSVTVSTGCRSPDYSAAKSGMIGLTKSIAIIGAPHGVRACCVSPGPVLTRPGRWQR
jgi:NAD(P)-dependent dehydrogenase (short-subunit alcohol dehydrogenase family)